MNDTTRLTQRFALGLSVVLLTILVLIPLALVMWRSFTPHGDFELLGPLTVVTQRNLLEVLTNSLLLGALVVVGTTLIALPLAFLAARTEIGRARWLDLVLLIPFMTPPYIGSMGWILFMQNRGLMDQFFPMFGFTRATFFSMWGVVLVMSLHLYPFLYLILKNALREIGGSLDDAGAICGGSFFYRLRRITLPLVFSSYTMGALLVFVKTISEFGTPATLGRRVGFYVLTTEIYRFTSNWPIDFASAAALSSVLLITSMIVWYVQSVLADRYQYSVIGVSGAPARLQPLGRWKVAAWAYVILTLLVSIGVPYFAIVGTSVMQVRGTWLVVDNLTLSHYAEIFRSGSLANRALWTSLRLAFSAAILSLLLGTFFAIVVSRTRGFFARLTDVSSLLSNTIPAIVVIVGLILLWNARWVPLRIYNTEYVLVLAYTVLFLPFTVQYVKANLSQLGTSLFDAARVTGGTPAYTFRRILLPLIRSGMVAGFIMTFIIAVRELVGSLMIRPPGTETTATYIFQQFEQGNASLGMAMALVTIGVTTIVLLAIQRIPTTAEL
jgi:iron(III) transport system permease protein